MDEDKDLTCKWVQYDPHLIFQLNFYCSDGKEYMLYSKSWVKIISNQDPLKLSFWFEEEIKSIFRQITNTFVPLNKPWEKY